MSRANGRTKVRIDSPSAPEPSGKSDESRWNPFAPVNIEPDGNIFRKTRFDLRDREGIQGEWMWVLVDSLETAHGVLTNDSIVDPRLRRGARVEFRVIPRGKPLAGCAVAVSWVEP